MYKFVRELTGGTEKENHAVKVGKINEIKKQFITTFNFDEQIVLMPY